MPTRDPRSSEEIQQEIRALEAELRQKRDEVDFLREQSEHSDNPILRKIFKLQEKRDRVMRDSEDLQQKLRRLEEEQNELTHEIRKHEADLGAVIEHLKDEVRVLENVDLPNQKRTLREVKSAEDDARRHPPSAKAA